MQPKTLNLVANPWAAIDAEGLPSGQCLRDPVEDGAPGYVGARIVGAVELRPKVTRNVNGVTQVISGARHLLTWEFDPKPVKVPNTGYYRDRAGKAPFELFAGDARTAAALGQDFVEPAKQIEAHRLLRVAEFDAQHGQGAWQELADERAAAAKANQPEAAPVVTETKPSGKK